MSEGTLTAYCLKCKAKREMTAPQAIYTSKGAPATAGVCPVCGARLFKMGATPAQAGVPKPPPAPVTQAPGDQGAPPAPTRQARKPAPKSAAAEQAGKLALQTTGRGKTLVIVESPTKARTVGRFLGREYVVKASVGHVRDLPKSGLAVDVDKDFQPKYVIPTAKRKTVSELKKAAEGASSIYLATDPDREGEAISWHLVNALGIAPSRYRRVVFHEITQSAVQEGFAHPRDLNMPLINAQQARRVLDRLVGYQISPLLWKNVRGRLSAGRVQSVALRLVVEREREIQAFTPVEYWTIEAELAKREPQKRSFIARLARIDGKEADLKNREDTQAIVKELEKADYAVSSVETGERRRFPAAPFTTSTLQQDANRRLGYTAKRTMAAAQKLYEGVDTGEGQVGLITYMRTDSVNVAAAAQDEARAYIGKEFGGAFLPTQPPQYKTRVRNAQEAHEAIRPTSVWRTPEQVKPHLDEEHFRLYDLIWRRFVASQMMPAVYDVTTVEVKANKRYLFRATGSVLKFPGFLKVYGQEAEKEEEGKEGEKDRGPLPPLTVGEWLDLLRLMPEQHYTQPPPRYTEASLVKKLEELGIGRPSTYAPILSVLQVRYYVNREGRQLIPTELGFVVCDLLVQHFPQVLDYDFTAQMEEELDDVSNGQKEWVAVLRQFYGPFTQALKAAQTGMTKVEMKPEETGLACPQCAGKVIVKVGRFGKFLACSNYPTCKYTASYVVKTGAKCPQCGGDLVEKKSKKGRTFYSCANYPTCTFAVWNRPLPQPCPACGGLLTDAGKKGSVCIKCGQTFGADKQPAQPG